MTGVTIESWIQVTDIDMQAMTMLIVMTGFSEAFKKYLQKTYNHTHGG